MILPHEFTVGVSYEWESPCAFDQIPHDELFETLSTTGQVWGFMAPLVLASRFVNLTFEYDEPSQSRFVREDSGRVWRTAVATKGNSFSLLASKMKGVGRLVDEFEHELNQLKIDGYILIEADHLPIVRVVSIPIADMAVGKMTVSRTEFYQAYHGQLTMFGHSDE